VHQFHFVAIILALFVLLTGCSKNEISKAENSYKTGLSLQVQGKLNEALHHYSEAIDASPDFALAYLARANIYNFMGEYRKSIEDLDKAIELDLQLASAYYLRRSAYNRLGEPNITAVDGFKESLEDASKAIQLARAYTDRGATKAQLDEHEDAIQDFNKAIELDPTNASAYLQRGKAYNELGRHETAIKDLDNAIRLDPYDPDSYAARAFAYSDLEQSHLAVRDLEQALRMRRTYLANNNVEPEQLTDQEISNIHTNALPDPARLPDNDIEPSFILEDLFLSPWVREEYIREEPASESDTTQDPERSVDVSAQSASTGGLAFPQQLTAEDFDKTIQILARYSTTYTERGLAYLQLGRNDEALTNLNAAKELNPFNVETYTNRGLAYIEMGRFETAIQDLDTSIEYDISNARAYAYRGLAYLKLGQYETALSNLEIAIGLDPYNPDAYANQGTAYLLLGQYTDAVSSLTEAIRLSSLSAKEADVYGTAYAIINRPDLIVTNIPSNEELESISEAPNPKLALIYNQRGRAYSRLELFEPALQDLEKAVRLDPLNADIYASRIELFKATGRERDVESDIDKAVSNGIDLSGLGIFIDGAESAE
jgi:tetratricopeptide (TPR) repeat protein